MSLLSVSLCVSRAVCLSIFLSLCGPCSLLIRLSISYVFCALFLRLSNALCFALFASSLHYHSSLFLRSGSHALCFLCFLCLHFSASPAFCLLPRAPTMTLPARSRAGAVHLELQRSPSKKTGQGQLKKRGISLGSRCRSKMTYASERGFARPGRGAQEGAPRLALSRLVWTMNGWSTTRPLNSAAAPSRSTLTRCLPHLLARCAPAASR